MHLEQTCNAAFRDIKGVIARIILLPGFEQGLQLPEAHLFRKRQPLFCFKIITVETEENLRPQILKHRYAVDPSLESPCLPPRIDG